MKREFLQNLKVGDQSLSKEVIDAIMAENGRDIAAAKAPFADYEVIKGQLGKAQEAIRHIQTSDQDMQSALEAAKTWEKKYNEAQEQHRTDLSRMAFDHALETAIARAKGRSAKAITALMDVDALRESENPNAAIEQALEALKKDSDYLFETAEIPPLYARGTGAYMGAADPAPATLADALRERFDKERM